LIGAREDLKQWHGIDKEIFDDTEWIGGGGMFTLCRHTGIK